MKEFGGNGPSEQCSNPYEGATYIPAVPYDAREPQSEIAPPSSFSPSEGEAGAETGPAYHGEPHAERGQQRRVTENLPTLARAEELDVEHLRELTQRYGRSLRVGKMMIAASNFTELGLATPDEAEAQQAFAEAQERYASILSRMELQPEPLLRASRQAEYVPIMQMRRAGVDEETIAAAAYAVLGRSIARVLPVVRPDDTRVPRYARSILAEDSVPSLLARVGHAPYISSYREETSSGRGGLSQASDFHLLGERSKTPVEVKYAKSAKAESGYDSSKVLVIRYVPDIGGVLGDEYGRQIVPNQQLNYEEVALHLSSLLMRESAGEQESLPPDAMQLLTRGSTLMTRKVDRWNWRRDTSANR